MKDKELKLEFETSHTLGGVGEGHVQGRGKLRGYTIQVQCLTESDTRPGGPTRKKPRDLSVCESENRGHGEGWGVYVTTLMESDTLQELGHTEADTRSGGRTHKKRKDLSVCESEECCHGVFCLL